MIYLTFKVINSMIMKNMKPNELKFNREQLRCIIHCVLTVIKVFGPHIENSRLKRGPTFTERRINVTVTHLPLLF